LAYSYHIDLNDTWSCYMGGDKPCGKCPACLIRENAVAEFKNQEMNKIHAE
jgi:7-cyano-7-deazaguanine synthase